MTREEKETKLDGIRVKILLKNENNVGFVCLFFSTLEVFFSVHCVFREIRSKGFNCEVLRLKETTDSMLPCTFSALDHK